MKIIDKILNSILGRIFLVVFVLTLFSFTGFWSVTQSSVAISESNQTLMTVTATLSLAFSFLTLTDCKIIQQTKVGYTNVVIDPITNLPTSFDVTTEMGDPTFVSPTMALDVLTLIGIILIIVGVIFSIHVHKNKILAFISMALIVAGTVVYLVMAGSNAFAPFTMILKNTSDVNNTIINLKVPGLSTGLMAILLAVVSVFHLLFVIFRKNKKA